MLQRLGPGSQVPAWAEALDLDCFGQAWPALEDNEHLWTLDDQALARWAVIPGGEAELLRIAVAPAARGKGLARRLLRLGVEALMAEGCHLFHLEVRVSNTAARGLYASEGWLPGGVRKAYYRDGEDAAVYRLETPERG